MLKTKAQPRQDVSGKYVIVWHKAGHEWKLRTRRGSWIETDGLVPASTPMPRPRLVQSIVEVVAERLCCVIQEPVHTRATDTNALGNLGSPDTLRTEQADFVTFRPCGRLPPRVLAFGLRLCDPLALPLQNHLALELRHRANDVEHKRDPYSLADLTCIFTAPLYASCKSVNRIMEPGPVLVRDHWYWFPLVALHSGMRLSEISQLEFDDIGDLNGRKHFSVNRQSHHGDKKMTKTKSSIRQI